jgi:hypothetical protein
MFKTKITLEEALEMESRGEITLISSYKDSYYHPNASTWYKNYEILRRKHSKIPAEKFISYLRIDLYTEVFVDVDDETQEWFIIHGIKNNDYKNKVKDNIEYVYILTNPGYPDLVKIGLTENNVLGRVKSINATSTVHEWVAKFALPVEKGSAFRVEQQMHKYFADTRIDSDQGNEREFFRIDPLTAFDKLREIGAVFQVGNPIVY